MRTSPYLTMSATAEANLSRKQIREIVRRHKGSVMRIAERAGVTHPGVSRWLKGHQASATIERNARAVALELLEQEQRNA